MADREQGANSGREDVPGCVQNPKRDDGRLAVRPRPRARCHRHRGRKSWEKRHFPTVSENIPVAVAEIILTLSAILSYGSDGANCQNKKDRKTEKNITDVTPGKKRPEIFGLPFPFGSR